MIDLGYMAKRIALRPDWLNALCVRDVYAVCNCVSSDFCDYINFWKHNDYWFFDTPALIRSISIENGIDLSGTALLFYRGYPQQFDAKADSWIDFAAESAFSPNVAPPSDELFLGFDVVTYSMQSSPECSPLSCNSLATELQVNEHCLIRSLDYAIECLENGAFANSEPGPYRIIAVNSIPWPIVG